MNDEVVGVMVNVIIKFDPNDDRDYEDKVGDLIIAFGDAADGIKDKWVQGQVFSMTEEDIEGIINSEEDD